MTDPDDAEFNRATGKAIREYLVQMSIMQLDEHSAMARWLTASLLAVNGGAALALLNSETHRQPDLIAGGSFAIGICAALLSAVLNQKANQKGVAAVGEAMGRALVVELTGEFDELDQELVKGWSAKVAKASRPPVVAGWVSAIMFAVGVVIVGFSLWSAFPSPQAPPSVQGTQASPVSLPNQKGGRF